LPKPAKLKDKKMTNFYTQFSTNHQGQRDTKLLPTRQQLIAFLQSKGINPEKLKQMTAWEQIQLTKEYQQAWY
jgi:hypothetical protein